MKRTMLAATAAPVFGLCAALPASADETVLRVLGVQPTDEAAYVKEVETLQALYKKAGLPLQIRVWRATYAGPNTGTIIVGSQAPDMATFAKLPAMIRANAEISAEMKKIQAMRKVVSDSLYEPLTD
jgi:hypothetical protein